MQVPALLRSCRMPRLLAATRRARATALVSLAFVLEIRDWHRRDRSRRCGGGVRRATRAAGNGSGLHRPHPSALWVDASATLTTNAVDALALLGHADDDGLDVDDYYVAPLRDLATRLRGTSPNAAVVAAFDVTLSAGMLRYLRDVHMGRLDPRALAVHLGGARDDHDFAAVLRSAIADGRVGAAADALRPQFAQYRLLRAALARYRTRARETT